MAGRKRRSTPADLARAERRFVTWRAGQKPRARIPQSLWGLAAGLAEKHGIYQTASVLKLHYQSLKKKVNASDGSTATEQRATFVEVTAPPPAGECVIYFEDGSGAKMRVHLRGLAAPDLAALSRSFWVVD